MKIDASTAALSGVRAGQTRLGASAHNVANLLTEDFRPLEVQQSAQAQGGVDVSVSQAAQPREVSLVDELVDQQLASLQTRASLRVLETDLDLLGQIVDLKA